MIPTISFQQVLMVFSFLFSFEVAAEGVFEVKIIKFVNNEGVDQTGKCCGDLEATQCNIPCQTSFRICLTHYQTNFDPSGAIGTCSYGSFTTGILGENTIQFVHPKVFRFNFTVNRWPGYFTLVIDALGQGNQASDGRLSLDTKEVILSRLVKSSQLHPARNGANSWSPLSPYIHRNSSLYYSYRMVCYKNYYGSDCSTYCDPRNDKIGHYSCDNQGKMVCLPGWIRSNEEDYCTKAICSSGCSGNGECEKPNVCRCSAGWIGPKCEKCLIHFKCKHGYCVKPHECRCKGGWGGIFCDKDLHRCARDRPCRNGGQCSNSGRGSYICSCLSGFSGKDCEIRLNHCSSSPCKNNGTCQNKSNGYRCICEESFAGKNCETPSACSSNPCQNKGTCKKRGGGYTCRCLAGWSGKNCQRSIPTSCPSNLCRNDGVCRVLSSEISCQCKAGFVGKFCQHRAGTRCADIMCLNGGSCSMLISVSPCQCARCKCLAQYSGPRCERFATSANTSYMEEQQNTKIVVREQTLKTSQWIGICFGSGAAVVLLVATACLVHHRKKVAHARRTKTPDRQEPVSDTNELHLNKMDSITADRDTSHRHSVFGSDVGDVPNEISCRQSRILSEKIDHEKKIHDLSKMRSSAKRKMPSDDQSLRRFSHQFQCDFNVDCESSMTNNVCNTAQRSNELLQSRNSRLPTYEEACKENDSLLGSEATNLKIVPSSSC